MSTIHERLLSAMRVAGVSQVALSRLTGIDITNVCHLLHGRRAPSVATLAKLLKALPDVDARWLVTGKD